jgi:hypothetical protein
MTIDRRSIIKGMALCGVAGPILAGARPAQAAAGVSAQVAHRTTLLLVSEGAADSAFVQGARAASHASALRVRLASHDLAFVLGLEKQLRDSPSMHVIGLLDDALATPLLDLARSAGARVPWLGHHTAELGISRHRLLTTRLTEGCAFRLGRHLQACGSGFTLVEERQDDAAATRRLSGCARSSEPADQWAAGVGYLLASLVAQEVESAPRLPASSAPLLGSFVSFSIEA